MAIQDRDLSIAPAAYAHFLTISAFHLMPLYVVDLKFAESVIFFPMYLKDLLQNNS